MLNPNAQYNNSIQGQMNVPITPQLQIPCTQSATRVQTTTSVNQLPGPWNVGNVGSTGLSNNTGLRPPILQMQQQQIMSTSVPMQGMGPNVQNIGNQGHKQALQQLMMLLKNKNPTNPQHQQQQILNILKSNPNLLSTFIKQRQAQNRNAPSSIQPRNSLQNLQQRSQQAPQHQQLPMVGQVDGLRMQSVQNTRVQQAELLRRRVAFMNTRTAPMTSAEVAMSGGQNPVNTIGLMSQTQSNATSQGGTSIKTVFIEKPK